MKHYPDAGTRVYVKHMGKHAPGTVIRPSALSDAAYRERGLVAYRCDWNKGEHLGKLADVKLLKTKTYKGPSGNRDKAESVA